jgi:hypothetical protein
LRLTILNLVLLILQFQILLLLISH